MKTLVEFIGAPGIGKSYVAFRLYRYATKNAGQSVVDGSTITLMAFGARLNHKLRAISIAVARAPKLMVKLVKVVLASGVRHPGAVIRLWSNWAFLLGHVHKLMGRADCVIMDQGFTQALVSTYIRGNVSMEMRRVRALFDELTKRAKANRLICVFIEAEPSVHRERLEAREAVGGYVPEISKDRWRAEAASIFKALAANVTQLENCRMEYVCYKNDGEDAHLSEFCDSLAHMIRAGWEIRNEKPVVNR